METAWFVSLLFAICFEGLGRKYMPALPNFVFYFMKDVVLIIGYFRFRPTLATRQAYRNLYRGFDIAFIVAFGWTAMELVNPDQPSAILAVVGMRSYWLWWIAPPVIASALQNNRRRERAIYALLIVTFAVSILAAFQFASPADSNLNLYQVQDGEEIHASDLATVASTGRARVSSTFTFVSGFVAFTTLVPTILLSIGLDSAKGRIRTAALVATSLSAAVIPMSGSRASIFFGVTVLFVTMWAGGLFFTRAGRRMLIGAAVAVVVSVVVFPEAMIGVESRFEDQEETTGRILDIADVLPPVALVHLNYPVMGIGTGTQQNVRFPLHVDVDWNAESEIGRYLVELGPVGFLAFWTARIGLVVALVRAYRLLKAAGRRGSAGAALSYAAVTMFGNQVFDHNWQALYFMGCGFVLAEVVSVRQKQAARIAVAPAENDRRALAAPDPAAA